MFFTTRAELSRVAQRNPEILQEFIRRKYGEKKLSLLDYTRFGMDSSVYQ